MGAMKAIHTDTQELVETVLSELEVSIRTKGTDFPEIELIDRVGEYALTRGWKSPTEMEDGKRRFMGLATQMVTAVREHGPDSTDAIKARADLIAKTLEFFEIDWFNELMDLTRPTS